VLPHDRSFLAVVLKNSFNGPLLAASVMADSMDIKGAGHVEDCPPKVIRQSLAAGHCTRDGELKRVYALDQHGHMLLLKKVGYQPGFLAWGSLWRMSKNNIFKIQKVTSNI
jgi:hypothetical protein